MHSRVALLFFLLAQLFFAAQGDVDIILADEQFSRALWKDMESVVNHFHGIFYPNEEENSGNEEAQERTVPSLDTVMRDVKLVEAVNEVSSKPAGSSSGGGGSNADGDFDIVLGHSSVNEALKSIAKQLNKQSKHEVQNFLLLRALFELYNVFVAEIGGKTSDAFRQNTKAMEKMEMVKRQVSENIKAMKQMVSAAATPSDEQHGTHHSGANAGGQHHSKPKGISLSLLSQELEHFERTVLHHNKFRFSIQAPRNEFGSGSCGSPPKSTGSETHDGGLFKGGGGSSSSSMNLKTVHNELPVPIDFTAQSDLDDPPTKTFAPHTTGMAPGGGFFPAQVSINGGEYLINFSDDTDDVVRVMFCNKRLQCQELIWVDDIRMSLYCYSLTLKQDGLGHYRALLYCFNPWPFDNNFELEFLVSGVYTSLNSGGDPAHDFPFFTSSSSAASLASNGANRVEL